MSLYLAHWPTYDLKYTGDRVSSGAGTQKATPHPSHTTDKASARLKGGTDGSFLLPAPERPGRELWNTNFSYVREGLLVETVSAPVCTRRAWFSLPLSSSAFAPKLTGRMGHPPREGQGVRRPVLPSHLEAFTPGQHARDQGMTPRAFP